MKYFKELELNIKHQNPKIRSGDCIGYEVEKGEYIFMLFVKLPFLKEMKNENRKSKNQM